MKKSIVYLLYGLLSSQLSLALVDFGNKKVDRMLASPICLDQEFAAISFTVNWQINNSYFLLQKSKDPQFSWAINTATFAGCGSCGSTSFSYNDFGPFVSGEVWHYRVRAISNNLNWSHALLGSFTSSAMSIVNWVSQVTNKFTTGSTPSSENSYNWFQETREMQGVQISLNPTEISNIYLEQNNHKIRFFTSQSTPFIALDVNVNNAGYNNLYNGPLVNSFEWANSINVFTSQNSYNLKVRFMDVSGTYWYREYSIFVTPMSDGLYLDNFCNSIRVWKGNDPINGTPLLLSEGFDAYCTKPQQYYRQAGKQLIDCLLNKGFNVYIIDYNLNAQSIVNNAAVYQSAIRYVSNINGNKKVVATGMSMGGVIARYASAHAESVFNPLPISKFVSIDAPQQGATLSKDFQDWRKNGLDQAAQNNSPDPFSEFASNNPAAIELLNYNPYDPNSNIHNSFYSTLNSLNGNGYPNLVESIGIAFSNSAANLQSGTWLTIQVSGVPGFQNQSFNLSAVELQAGSYLPQINVDPFAATDSRFMASLFLSLLRPITNPYVTITQTKFPTFIARNSALDIRNGTSMFDKVIAPNVTGFHDQIPSTIIEEVVNALIEDQTYVQNKTISSSRISAARIKLLAGQQVNPQQNSGIVNVTSNSDVLFKAGTEVALLDGFQSINGSEFAAIIGTVQCNGNQEFQNRYISPSALEPEHITALSTGIPAIYLNNPDFNIEYGHPMQMNGEPYESINIIPNPAEHEVYLTGLDDLEVECDIYSTDNKLLFSYKGNNKKIQIDFLPKGLYILKVTTIHNNFYTFKLIKN